MLQTKITTTNKNSLRVADICYFNNTLFEANLKTQNLNRTNKGIKSALFAHLILYNKLISAGYYTLCT